MERLIKIGMFIVLVVNATLWLNNIKLYPSLCFPRFTPSTNETKEYISFTRFSFKNDINKEVSHTDVILEFKPYDKRFYFFSLKMIANEEVAFDKIEQMPKEVLTQNDSIRF